MISTILAAAGVAVALVIGLGRQCTVFTAWKGGIGIFRRYPQKRLTGAIVAISLLAISLATGPPARPVPFAVAIVVLLVIAFLFRLEWMFPALNRVMPVQAEEANLDDDALVMLVTGSDPTAPGESDTSEQVSRAYPLDRMVIARHLVHDTIGSTPVVVTYCALCRSGLAFRAEVDGNTARFRVVGVFRRNLIMEDDVSFTLWQQATGHAVFGPYAGTTLELLPSVQLPWGAAKRDSGSSLTLAMEPPDTRPAPFASNRGFRLLKLATDHVTVPGYTKLSDRLPRRETVFGVVVNGSARAYPEKRCREAGRFTDTLGGVRLDFVYDQDRQTLMVTRADGTPPPAIEKHWWLGWNEFHPESTVWEP